MEPNPYQPPSQTRPAPKKPSKVSFTVGIILIVLACAGMTQGIKRPPNSRGDLLDDMPFILGQLFVPAILIVLGGYLVIRGRIQPKPSA
jgi:hypothetical protein